MAADDGTRGHEQSLVYTTVVLGVIYRVGRYVLQTAHSNADMRVVLFQSCGFHDRSHIYPLYVGYFVCPGIDTRQKGPTAFSVS